MKNRSLWRKVSSTLLAFFLAMMVFGINAIIGLHLGVFANHTMEQSIKESNYYEGSYEVFEQTIASMADEIPNVSKEVIYEVLPLKQFYIDASIQTEHLLSKKKTSEFATQKENRIQQIVTAIKEEQQNAQVQQNELEQQATYVLDVYEQQLEFNLLEEITVKSQTAERISLAILAGLLIMSGITILFLCKMYYHKHKAIRYVIYSITGACGMTLQFVSMVEKRMGEATITAGPAHYKRWIECYMEQSVEALWYPVGAGAIMIGLLLLILYEMRKRAMGE